MSSRRGVKVRYSRRGGDEEEVEEEEEVEVHEDEGPPEPVSTKPDGPPAGL